MLSCVVAQQKVLFYFVVTGGCSRCRYKHLLMVSGGCCFFRGGGLLSILRVNISYLSKYLNLYEFFHYPGDVL